MFIDTQVCFCCGQFHKIFSSIARIQLFVGKTCLVANTSKLFLSCYCLFCVFALLWLQECIVLPHHPMFFQNWKTLHTIYGEQVLKVSYAIVSYTVVLQLRQKEQMIIQTNWLYRKGGWLALTFIQSTVLLQKHFTSSNDQTSLNIFQCVHFFLTVTIS